MAAGTFAPTLLVMSSFDQPTEFSAILKKRLTDLSVENLTELIMNVPVLSSRILPPDNQDRRDDHIIYYGHHRPLSEGTLDNLARFLARDEGIHGVLDALNQLQRAIVRVTAWRDGSATMAELIDETGATKEEINAAIQGVLATFLADETDQASPHPDENESSSVSSSNIIPIRTPNTDGPHVSKPKRLAVFTLHPSVSHRVELPGVSAQRFHARSYKSQLQDILKRLGNPQRDNVKHAELLSLLVQSLSSAETVKRSIDSVSQETRDAIETLRDGKPRRIKDFTNDYYSPFNYGRYFQPKGILKEFIECGIVGLCDQSQSVWLWLESIVALNDGRLFRPVDTSLATLATQPFDPGASMSRIPAAERHARTILEAWKQKPPTALADASLGVKPIRDVAKQLGITAERAGLLANLLKEIDLIAAVTASQTGKGRNTKYTYEYRNTDASSAWQSISPLERWKSLVVSWVFATSFDEAEGLPERIQSGAYYRAELRSLRRYVLDKLLSLSESECVDATRFAQSMQYLLPAQLQTDTVATMLEIMRYLGLIYEDRGDVVALTQAGRALLLGKDIDLSSLDSQFVLQADHTIVASPHSDSELISTLERYAEVESTAGAHIYRISEERIAREIASGATAEDVIGFFSTHSNTPVPQNVEYLVRDVAKRSGCIQAGSAGSYLVSEDAAQFARVLAVKPAQLTQVAPTVAVSPLSFEQLESALQKKGIFLPAQESPTLIPLAKSQNSVKVDGPIVIDISEAQLAVEALCKREESTSTSSTDLRTRALEAALARVEQHYLAHHTESDE